MKYNLLLLLSLIIGSFMPIKANTNTEKELNRLDEYLERKSEFDNKKTRYIDSLCNRLSKSRSLQEAFDLQMAIADEYTLFKSDSAIVYYTLAYRTATKIGDNTRQLHARLQRLRPEVIAGFYTEAFDEFRTIESEPIPDNVLPLFYQSGYRMYSFMLNAVQSNIPGWFNDSTYREKTIFYRKKWVATIPESEPTKRLYEAEQLASDNKKIAAKMVLSDLMGDIKENTNEYAIAAAIMGHLLKDEGKIDESIRYFATSAISDIQCSVKENLSMFELSMLLYSRNDIDRAYRYIFSSIEDAASCNAKMRVLNVSSMLPVIESAQRKEVKSHEQLLMTYIAIVSILLIGLIIAVLFLYKQMKKLSATRTKLKQANMTKDEYMGQFLELSSIYMKRLESFSKMVNRKLQSGQVEDLMKTIKSSKFTDEQHRGFYKEFDHAYLKIYTTFVEDFNNLLRPEERIELEDPNSLTTELRIYALLRLGMEDSSKIAEFLKYSINTIYTYRNKMKNKALNRETFEQDVMKIGVID